VLSKYRLGWRTMIPGPIHFERAAQNIRPPSCTFSLNSL
jgi:hypothetical protein